MSKQQVRSSLRVNFKDWDVRLTMRPAIAAWNEDYALAVADAPQRLTFFANELSEAGAINALAQIYWDTVLSEWEGDGANDPESFLVANPELLFDIVSYATHLPCFLVSEGDPGWQKDDASSGGSKSD